MEIFSALLAICAGNSPVSGEFPAQRPVTGCFDIFFDLRLNKRLSKQSWGWCFETLSCLLWRQCNGHDSKNMLFLNEFIRCILALPSVRLLNAFLTVETIKWKVTAYGRAMITSQNFWWISYFPITYTIPWDQIINQSRQTKSNTWLDMERRQYLIVSICICMIVSISISIFTLITYIYIHDI